MLGVTDAAALPSDVPGRAVARLGGGVIPFQAARVSVPVPPEIVVTSAPGPSPAAGADDAAPAAAAPPTILRALIDAARAAAGGMPPAERPWLPELPTRITAREAAPSTFAVADQPERQRRQEVGAPPGSALVLGPPQSGRSTALRRIASLAAAAHHELIVIDGADSLADMATWPAVSTYLTSREPRLILRVLALLADPARRPEDDHLRHMIVDHLDLVTAELERTDFATGASPLTELLTRDAGSVRISAAGPDHLRHHRLAAGFREVIELGGDAGRIPGRGRWAGQVVQVVDEPAGIGTDARPAERPRDPIVVRPLPAVVTLSQLPAPVPQAVPFAVGGDAALPLTVDLTGAGGGIVIAGPRRSGVTTAVAALAGQATRAGIPVMWVATQLTPAPGIAGVTIVPCRGGVDELVAALKAHSGPLLLVADHGEAGEAHPAAAVFERFLAVCGPGQHLLIGVRIDAALRGRRGHLAAAASCRRGALLSPDQAHGALLDVSLPRRIGTVAAGRGVWTWDGTTSPVQFPRPRSGRDHDDEPRARAV